MLKDEIDVSFAAEYVLVGKAFNKDEIKAIASINEADFAYIIGRKDRGIQSISDLKGKKIGVARGTVLEFYLGRFLQLHGLSPEDVIMVDVALSKSADSIVSGESDALISFKPYTDLAQHELGDDVVVWPAQNSQALYALIICRDQWINQDPGRVERLLKALSAAEDFITQHPQEAKDITKRQLGFSDTYMDTVWPKQQYSLSLDQSLVTAMEDEARWMISNNLTAETQVPDFLRYIYVDGLNEVKPAAVNIIR
jgi:NitT/TauT family transport system substrate-binding protein